MSFKKVGNVFCIFTFIFFVFVIWQFNAFCITVFFTVIVTMILALVFIVFKALFLNMFIKLFLYYRNIHTFFNYQLHQIFACYFQDFFIISCLAVSFFLSLHCFCVFVLTFDMFFICLLILRTIIHQQLLLFFDIYANIDKDANCLQSNNNTSSKNLWLFFSASLLFLKVWLKW